MATMTTEAEIAKILFDDAKDSLARGNTAIKLCPHDNMWERTYKGETTSLFKFGKTEIVFPLLDRVYKQEEFWNKVYSEFRKLADGKFKGFVISPRYKTATAGNWWSPDKYEILSSITIVKPCAEFKKLNKKIEKLGLKPIDSTEWRYDSVAGKRSSYGVSESHYKCTDTNLCTKVLDYLKGIKKATVEIKRNDNLENRDYGERYETEWYGSIDYWLVVTTSKGTKTF